MTASAVRDVHAVLAGAFKQAQVWGWIDHDPMALVTRPAAKRADVRPPQVAQAEQLIDTAMAQDAGRSPACRGSCGTRSGQDALQTAAGHRAVRGGAAARLPRGAGQAGARRQGQSLA